MESRQSNNYAAPVTAICVSLNANYLIGLGIRCFVFDESIGIVALLISGIIWTVWAYCLWQQNIQLTKMQVSRQVYLAAIPVSGNLALLLGVFF